MYFIFLMTKGKSIWLGTSQYNPNIKMENQRLNDLIYKYILKNASIEEQQELLDWYQSQNNHETAWSSDDLNEEALVKSRLLSNIKVRIGPKVKPVPLWWRMKGVAAAVIAAIVLGVLLYNNKFDDTGVTAGSIAAVNDIAPGKHAAVITLPDGTAVLLNEAKSGVVIDANSLKYNDGSVVQNSSVKRFRGTNKMIMASTPRGGTYQVILPDGTRVWLNAESEISFPVQFSKGIRKVKLSGEGYFEVAKLTRSSKGPGSGKERVPFIVVTDNQEVKVLGTHFNVNAYKNEAEVKTTLLEGSVQVATRAALEKNVQNVILKPNQQSVLFASNRLAIKNVDVNEAVSWKDGDFNFMDEDIKSIMRKLERWYNIEVNFSGTASEERYYARISRSKNISEVLKMLERAKGVHFKIEGRRVTVLN